MTTALRFSPDAPAQACAEGDFPDGPGGGIWCDIDRTELPDAQQAGNGTPARRAPAGAGRWLDTLHPVTRTRLRRATPSGFGTVHPEYVHVRVPVAGIPPPGRAGHADAPVPPSASPMDIVLGSDFAITVHGGRAPGIAWLQEQYRTGQRRADGVDMAIYELLEDAVMPLRAHTDRLIASSDDLSERLVDLHARRILRQIVILRRHASRLRSLAAPAVAALGVLEAAGPHRALRDACIPLYRDLLHQAREVLGDIDDARDTLGQAVEAYTSVQSTEMNRIMQLFTVVAVIFMPPTLIASIYGMNFRIPEYGWPFGYAWALGLMGVVSGLLIVWMHQRNWL